MGRDKPKKYNKMGYFQKQAYYEEQGKKYGIDRDRFENSQGGGGGRYEDFNHDGFRDAVKNAQRNDFDYRTSAQHMDGIKGDGSSADFVNYQRGAQKLHKKAGNGGKYSSNKDITSVTNNLVNDYRRDLDDRISNIEGDDEQTDTAIKPTDSVPYERSQRSIDAEETVNNWNNTYGVGGSKSPYGNNSPTAPDVPSPYGSESSKSVTTDVNEFVNNYKKDVKAAFNIQPVLS